MYKVNIYTYVEPATVKRTKKMYAYLLQCVGKEEVELIGIGEKEGTYHETSLQAVNEAMGRLNQSCEVRLHCEDTFILNMFAHNITRWAAAGYKNAKGEPIANAEAWMELWRVTRAQKMILCKGDHEKKDQLRKEVRKCRSQG